MKFSDCNIREKRAWRNIKNAASYHIFGIMNGFLDGDDCMGELNDIDGMIETVYNSAITNIYSGTGSVILGKHAEMQLNDIKFCGKEFLMKVTTHYCKKYQQEAFQEISKRL